MKTCYTTNYLQKEFFKETEFEILDDASSRKSEITVDVENVKQTLVGFGGAFTEAAALNYASTNSQLREKIMKMYFDPNEGIGYQLGRMSINSCDFARSNYTYIRKKAKDLRTFTIRREMRFIVPMINDAKKYAPDLEMKAAPWSPPRHWKSNENMNFGGKLLRAYYGVWANYMLRFIKEMRAEGVPLKYLSVQNEPEATQTWDSCVFTPEEEMELIKIVGKKIERKELDIKIIALDHNRDILERWAEAFKKDEEALKYTWAFGIHWYVSEDFDALRRTKEMLPDKEIIFTEGCVEGGPRPYAIETGERYARNIIGDLSNGCIGYIDWNLLLDENGGPNHARNYCDAPILVAKKNKSEIVEEPAPGVRVDYVVDETEEKELIINSSYYYIGHFSKFLRRGSKIVTLENQDSRIQVLAGINQDQKQICVICNPTDETVNYQINGLKEEVEGLILPHTIQTWVVE